MAASMSRAYSDAANTHGETGAEQPLPTTRWGEASDAKAERKAQAAQRSVMLAFAGVIDRSTRSEEASHESIQADEDEVLAPDAPFAQQGAKVIEPSGEEITWPWESPKANSRPCGKATPVEPKKRKRDGPNHTSLMERALLVSNADGAGGENTTGMRAWREFCLKRGYHVLRALDPNASLAEKLAEEHICMEFICWLIEERGIAVGSAANYFGSVQGYQAKAGGVKLCGGLKLSRLPAMLKGLRRIIGENPRKQRRGVPAQLLKKAMDECLDPSIPLHANLRAALAVAFQGLLRSAEYCHDGKKGSSLARLLEKIPSRADIEVLDLEKLILMICPCKNMKHLKGKTVPLVIGAGGAHVDAVAEVRNLLAVDDVSSHDKQLVPLFRDPATNMPLHADCVRGVIQKLMAHVGQDPKDFGTHSLRIGGATALFAAGATPTVIRTMGRWSSDCYRLYVRACYEASMSWTKRAGSTAVTDLAGEFEEVDDY